MSIEYKYALNLETGRVTFYNREVATQTAYAAIPTDVALAIGRKEINWHDVVELIHKKRNEKGSGFSWEVFDKLRDRQNIRRAKYELETLGEEPENIKEEEEMLEAGDISIAELATSTKASAKPGRRSVSATDNVSRISSAAPVGDVKITV